MTSGWKVVGTPVPEPPVPQPVAMEFSLHEAGWASLTVRCGERHYKIENFGYCTDGLGDVVRAALSIATGATHAEVLFDGEPNLWGLAIAPAGLSPESVRIAWLTIREDGGSLDGEGYANIPVWKWTSPILLEGFVTTDAFARAVLAMAKKAREDFDDATYRARWGFYGSLEGFPLRATRALETALSIREYRE